MPTQNQSYLVTGGAGFIGSHIASALVARGEKVKVIDNLITGKNSNLDTFRDRIEFIKVDIRNFDEICGAFSGVSHVFHQAAIPSVPKSVAEPQTESRCQRYRNVQCASRCTRGRSKTSHLCRVKLSLWRHRGTSKREDLVPAPLSPYAAAKLVGEYYAQAFSESYGLETVSLRYFNVFGPRQDPTSAYSGVISKFITTLLAGETPVIYGDGEQTRDFTFVDHVVDANLRAAQMPEARGEVMNIGTGSRLSLNALLSILQKIIGTDCKPRYEPARTARTAGFGS